MSLFVIRVVLDLVSNEIRDTIVLGVSLFVLSIVLTFVSVIMSIKSDLASARNSTIESARHIAEYREFNKYNNTIVYGEDVVCAIRDFYDKGIRIKVVSSNGDYYVDKYVAREDAGLVDIDNIRLKFPVTKKYKAILVYGQVDLDTVTESYVAETVNNDVSSIVFFDKGAR